MRKKWTQEEDLILRSMYGKYPYRYILDKLPGRTKKALTGRAAYIGLKGNISLVMSKEKTKYEHDESFFIDVDLISSYWAGFIAADGNIRKNYNEVRISLSNKDVGHLERFKQDIKYTGAISQDSRGCSTISVYSRKFKHHLKENFNITPNKTFSLLPPPRLDYRYAFAYIIGYIDGDGSVMFRTNEHSCKVFPVIKVVGTEKVLEFIKKFVEDNFMTLRNIKRKSVVNKYSSVYEYSFSNHKAENFFVGSFELEVPRLRRKWAPALDFVKQKGYNIDYNYYSF